MKRLGRHWAIGISRGVGGRWVSLSGKEAVGPHHRGIGGIGCRLLCRLGPSGKAAPMGFLGD
jgi:hypothetical protein